ncbi:unnamed protein product [Brassica rapa subsp. narinosa]
MRKYKGSTKLMLLPKNTEHVLLVLRCIKNLMDPKGILNPYKVLAHPFFSHPKTNARL